MTEKLNFLSASSKLGSRLDLQNTNKARQSIWIKRLQEEIENCVLMTTLFLLSGPVCSIVLFFFVRIVYLICSHSTPKGDASKYDDDYIYLCLDFKKAPIHATMVDHMLWINKVSKDAMLDHKWETFKQVICSCAQDFFACLNKISNGRRNIA